MTHKPKTADCFTVQLCVRISAGQTSFPAIATDKAWNGGTVEDFLSRQNCGHSLKTGALPGWSLALQPNGSWAWNIADGEKRLDYLPTPVRQPLDDDRWHHLAFSVDRQQQEARLYYDGDNVAIYSLAGLGPCYGDSAPRIGTDATMQGALLEGEIEGFTLRESIASPEEIATAWTAHNPAKKPAMHSEKTLNKIRVLTWNIWNGGREDGVEEGVERVIDVIRDSRADIVAMQETYGSGPRIADGLGYYFYSRSSNLSLLSRFPIRETHDLYDDSFRFGGATFALAPGQHLDVYSLWIHYLPDFCNDVRQTHANAAALIAAEEQTRGHEIRDILKALSPRLRDKSRTIIVAGDFNSPSHLDWVPQARTLHRDLVVEWPVSRTMAEAGFTDAYRQARPNPLTDPGRTWTPRSTESWQDRIDYVYYNGQHMRCRAAEVLEHHPDGWPSDHAGVLATLQLT